MSEIQLSSEQLPTPSPIQSQPPVQPQPGHGFSGKQVVGIILGVLMLLALGLAIGGAIGYRLGAADGARQAVANLPAPQAVVPQAPVPDQQLPPGFSLPFGQQLPAINPGGPYLGVQFQMITPEIAAQEGITGTTGALIREVVAGGPASAAGLKANDVIVAVNGQPVDEQNDLRSRVAEFKSGDEITLTVVKGTANGPIDQRDVKVKLGERPSGQSFDFQMPFDGNGLPQLPFGDGQLPEAPATGRAYLGVEFEMITPEVAARENITGTTGALLKAVMADSPAAKAGLKIDDVITAVDGKPIDDVANLRAIVQNHQPGDELKLTIVQGTANGPTDQREVTVVLAARPAEQQFRMPPGFLPGAPSPDSREG